MQIKPNIIQKITSRIEVKSCLIISGILCLVGVIGIVRYFVHADSSTYTLLSNTVTLDGQNNSTISIELKNSLGHTYTAFEGVWSVHEIVEHDTAQTNYFTLNKVSFGTNDCEFNTTNGLTACASGGLTVNANATIMTAEYVIDKDTPAGTYTISIDADYITYENGESDVDDENISKETTITVVRSNQPIQCDTDEELVNGKCVKKCKAGEERINGVCQEKPIQCDTDEELVNGKCVKKCKAGEERINGVCQEKPIQCDTDEELVNGKCVNKNKQNGSNAQNNNVATTPGTGNTNQDSNGTSTITIPIVLALISAISFITTAIYAKKHEKINF